MSFDFEDPFLETASPSALSAPLKEHGIRLTRQRELRASDIASARQVEVAEQELASAQGQARTAEATLRMAGAAQSAPSGRYTLSSPIGGTVVRRTDCV